MNKQINKLIETDKYVSLVDLALLNRPYKLNATEFLTFKYIYINTHISRCSDKFNFQLVIKFCIVIYYIELCGCTYIICCVVNCNL
jgi:hypothetical protein